MLLNIGAGHVSTAPTNFPLLAIPMFILAGAIMNATGHLAAPHRLRLGALLGFIRGGLAMVNIGASMFFAEISGSAVADVAAIGSILMPAMKKRGYPAAFAAAVTSSSATSLAVIIPPSIPMILYGVMSNSSVVELFVAGIIPGLLGRPRPDGRVLLDGAAPRLAGRGDLPALEKLWRTFKEAAWALLLPVIILGGIFGGLVTATEGAGLAVLSR